MEGVCLLCIRRKKTGSNKIVHRPRQLKVRQIHEKLFATTNFQYFYFEKCVRLDLLHYYGLNTTYC